MRRGQHWLLLVWWRQRILRRRKGKEIGRDPIEITHIHPFEFLVSARGVSKWLAEEGREDTYSSRPNSRRFTIPFSLAFHTPYTTSCTFRTKSACEYPASRNGMSGGSHWASGDSARCGGQLWTRTCTKQQSESVPNKTDKAQNAPYSTPTNSRHFPSHGHPAGSKTQPHGPRSSGRRECHAASRQNGTGGQCAADRNHGGTRYTAERHRR